VGRRLSLTYNGEFNARSFGSLPPIRVHGIELKHEGDLTLLFKCFVS
jgi:hypothetical protein